MNNNSDNSLKIVQEIHLKKCRLCQENDGTIEFLTNSILCERILLCTKINIGNSEENKQLPKEICTNCNNNLTNFKIFQENCLKVNEQLKKLLANTKPSAIAKTKFPRKLSNLNKKNSICTKCNEPKKSSRHCCKIEQLDEIKPENILVKIKSNETDSTALDNNVSYILVISQDNQIKNETEIEITNEKLSEKAHENCEEDYRYEILEEIPYQSDNNIPSTDASESEDDFKEQFKKVRRTKDSTGARNYVCNIADCGKIFSTKSGLKKHRYAEHNIRDFLCTTCGKHFGEHSGLKVHERIHASTRPYQCTKCNIGFVQAANLRTHIKLHHEGHRYYCTQCGKGFLTSCTLKRHELIHIGKKDFKCDMCSSEFYTRRELLKHKKYHFDIRSHFCNICYKSFVEKHHLTIHMRSHTGERPYVCDMNGCTKSFMDSQKLRRHKKNVHRCRLNQTETT